MTAPLKSNWKKDEKYDEVAINAVADRINANTDQINARAAPFVIMYPRQNVDQGNGTDGRMPAASLPDATSTAAYYVGVNGPWTLVDVYIAWMEGVGGTPGDIMLTTYLGKATESVRPISVIISNAKLYPVSATLAYHETLCASGIDVTPFATMFGTVVRVGADVLDTYTSSVGLIGVILKPH